MLTQIFIPSGVWAVLSGIILVWLKGIHGAYDMIQQYFKFTWQGFKVDVLHSHIFGTFWFFFNRPDILLLFYFIIVYIVIEVFSRESKESKEKDLLKTVLVILVLQMFFVALLGRKYVQYSSVYYVWLLLAYTLIVQRVVKGSIKIVAAVLVFILLVPNGVIAYRSQVSNWKDVGKSQEAVAFLRENTAEEARLLLLLQIMQGIIWHQRETLLRSIHIFIHQCLTMKMEFGRNIERNWKKRMRRPLFGLISKISIAIYPILKIIISPHILVME